MFFPVILSPSELLQKNLDKLKHNHNINVIFKSTIDDGAIDNESKNLERSDNMNLKVNENQEIVYYEVDPFDPDKHNLPSEYIPVIPHTIVKTGPSFVDTDNQNNQNVKVTQLNSPPLDTFPPLNSIKQISNNVADDDIDLLKSTGSDIDCFEESHSPFLNSGLPPLIVDVIIPEHSISLEPTTTTTTSTKEEPLKNGGLHEDHVTQISRTAVHTASADNKEFLQSSPDVEENQINKYNTNNLTVENRAQNSGDFQGQIRPLNTTNPDNFAGDSGKTVSIQTSLKLSQSPNKMMTEDENIGQYLMRNVMLEFTLCANQKTEAVLYLSGDKPIYKFLQKGEDPNLDQDWYRGQNWNGFDSRLFLGINSASKMIIDMIGELAEFTLPSLIDNLNHWLANMIMDCSSICDSIYETISNRSRENSNDGSPQNDSKSQHSVIKRRKSNSNESGNSLNSSLQPALSTTNVSMLTCTNSHIIPTNLISGLVGAAASLIGSSNNNNSSHNSNNIGTLSANSSSFVLGNSSNSGLGVEKELTKEQLKERRKLAIEIIYCRALLSALPQFKLHPGHFELSLGILDQIFNRFHEFCDISMSNCESSIPTTSSSSSCNSNQITQPCSNGGPASVSGLHVFGSSNYTIFFIDHSVVFDLYAELLAILAESRFQLVANRIWLELNSIRNKETSFNTTNTSTILITMLMGIKFLRIQMVPIDQFEEGFKFLQQLANYFLETKNKEIKHAIAAILVDILVPIASKIKNEVNIPCVKQFVESLYQPVIDMLSKKKHAMAIFPLTTCLFCVSHKQFFTNNFQFFSNLCLTNLKSKDSKLSRIAFESLYRLIWVYMIRLKGESNSITSSRLLSIVNSLYPKGGKILVPKDAPLNIFVKIIQFISQQRLDFVFQEIIMELLNGGKPIKIVLPERMSVGLRGFLVIADNLQQREGEPPMPQNLISLPSGNTMRRKRVFINKSLTERLANSLGITSEYYVSLIKSYEMILTLLDNSIGKPYLMIVPQANKDHELNSNTERKAKMDLFKTCVAAIPRLFSEDPKIRCDMIDILVRLTIHVDEKLRGLSYQALQTIFYDYLQLRPFILKKYIVFISNNINDGFSYLLENSLKLLLQLLVSFRGWLVNLHDSGSAIEVYFKELSDYSESIYQQDLHGAFQMIEAFSFIVLCQNNLIHRKLSLLLIKETRDIVNLLALTKNIPSLYDCILSKTLTMVETLRKHFTNTLAILNLNTLTSTFNYDFQALFDFVHNNANYGSGGFPYTATNISAKCELGGSVNNNHSNSTNNCTLLNSGPLNSIWIRILGIILENSSTTITNKNNNYNLTDDFKLELWNLLNVRLAYLNQYFDTSVILAESRASLLRSSVAKKTTYVIEREKYKYNWEAYLTIACIVIPPEMSYKQLEAFTFNNRRDETSVPQQRKPSPATPSPSSSPETISRSSIQNLDKTPFIINKYTNYYHHHHNSTTLNSKSSSPTLAFPTSYIAGNFIHATSDFYKTITTTLTLENIDVRGPVLNSLKYFNPLTLGDLMVNLENIINEAVENKQENIRRRKKRETNRVRILNLLECLAHDGLFAKIPTRYSFFPNVQQNLCGFPPSSPKDSSTGHVKASLILRNLLEGMMKCILQYYEININFLKNVGGFGCCNNRSGEQQLVRSSYEPGTVPLTHYHSPPSSSGFSSSGSQQPFSHNGGTVSSNSSLISKPFAIVNSLATSLTEKTTGGDKASQKSSVDSLSLKHGGSGGTATPQDLDQYEATVLFCRFVYHLISHFELESRFELLNDRKALVLQLFTLFNRLSGKLGFQKNTQELKKLKYANFSFVEILAFKTLLTVMTALPLQDLKLSTTDNNDNGLLFKWFEGLLSCPNKEIVMITISTLTYLLILNPDLGEYLEWLIEKSYSCSGSGSFETSKLCFKVICDATSYREMLTEMVPIFTLAFTYVGSDDSDVRLDATKLLYILDQQFFKREFSATAVTDFNNPHNQLMPKQISNYVPKTRALTLPFYAFLTETEKFVSYFRDHHEELTLSFFSEILFRYTTANNYCRTLLVKLLVPWMYRVRLTPLEFNSFLTNYERRYENSSSPSSSGGGSQTSNNKSKPYYLENTTNNPSLTSFDTKRKMLKGLTGRYHYKYNYYGNYVRGGGEQMKITAAARVAESSSNSSNQMSPHLNLTSPTLVNHSSPRHRTNFDTTLFILNDIFYLNMMNVSDYKSDFEAIWSSLLHNESSYYKEDETNMNVIVDYLTTVVAMLPTHHLNAAFKVYQTVAALNYHLFLKIVMKKYFMCMPPKRLMNRIDFEHYPCAYAAALFIPINHYEDGITPSIEKGGCPPYLKKCHERHAVYPKNGIGIPNYDFPYYDKPAPEYYAYPDDIGSFSPAADDYANSELVYKTTVASGVATLRKVPVVATINPQVDSTVDDIYNDDVDDDETYYPYPMPAYGGFNAPLNLLFVSNESCLAKIPRCFMGIILINKTMHNMNENFEMEELYKIIHLIILGLDYPNEYVRLNCEQLLVNLLLQLAWENNFYALAHDLSKHMFLCESLDRTEKYPTNFMQDFRIGGSSDNGTFNDMNESLNFKLYLMNQHSRPPIIPSGDALNKYPPGGVNLPGHKSQNVVMRSKKRTPQQRDIVNVRCSLTQSRTSLLSETPTITPARLAELDRDIVENEKIRNCNKKWTDNDESLSDSSYNDSVVNIDVKQGNYDMDPFLIPEEAATSQAKNYLRNIVELLKIIRSKSSESSTDDNVSINVLVDEGIKIYELVVNLYSFVNVLAPHLKLDEKWSRLAMLLAFSSNSKRIVFRSLQVFRSFGNINYNSLIINELIGHITDVVGGSYNDITLSFFDEMALTVQTCTLYVLNQLRPLVIRKSNTAAAIVVGNNNMPLIPPTTPANHLSLMTRDDEEGSEKNQKRHTYPFDVNDVESFSQNKSLKKLNIVTITPSAPPLSDANDGGIKVYKGSAGGDNKSQSCLEITKDDQSTPNNGAAFNSGSGGNNGYRIQLPSDTGAKISLIARVYWFGVSLLESEVQHEFWAGIRLITLIYRNGLNPPDSSSLFLSAARDYPPNHHPQIHEFSCMSQKISEQLGNSLEKFFFRLKWTNFKGVINLLFKGFHLYSSHIFQPFNEYYSNIKNNEKYGPRDAAPTRCPKTAQIFMDILKGNSLSPYEGLLVLLANLIQHPRRIFAEHPSHCLKAAPPSASSSTANNKAKRKKDYSSQAQSKIITYPSDIQKALLILSIHLIENFNIYKRTPLTREICQALIKYCQKYTESESLSNFSIIISLYERNAFTKSSIQWIKCVVTYIFEAYPSSTDSFLSFILEIFKIKTIIVNFESPTKREISCKELKMLIKEYPSLLLAGNRVSFIHIILVGQRRVPQLLYVKGPPKWQENLLHVLSVLISIIDVTKLKNTELFEKLAMVLRCYKMTNGGCGGHPPTITNQQNSTNELISSIYYAVIKKCSTLDQPPNQRVPPNWNEHSTTTSFIELDEIFPRHQLAGPIMTFNLEPPIRKSTDAIDKGQKCGKRNEETGKEGADVLTEREKSDFNKRKRSIETSLFLPNNTIISPISHKIKNFYSHPPGTFNLSPPGVIYKPSSTTWSLYTLKKGPQTSQEKLKDRVDKLLNAIGQNKGIIKSPSIMLHTHRDVQRNQSYSSGDNTVTAANSFCLQASKQSTSGHHSSGDTSSRDDISSTFTEKFVGIFKDFDFLDVELEKLQDDELSVYELDNFHLAGLIRHQSLASHHTSSTYSVSSKYSLSSHSSSMSALNNLDIGEISKRAYLPGMALINSYKMNSGNRMMTMMLPYNAASTARNKQHLSKHQLLSPTFSTVEKEEYEENSIKLLTRSQTIDIPSSTTNNNHAVARLFDNSIGSSSSKDKTGGANNNLDEYEDNTNLSRSDHENNNNPEILSTIRPQFLKKLSKNLSKSVTCLISQVVPSNTKQQQEHPRNVSQLCNDEIQNVSIISFKSFKESSATNTFDIFKDNGSSILIHKTQENDYHRSAGLLFSAQPGLKNKLEKLEEVEQQHLDLDSYEEKISIMTADSLDQDGDDTCSVDSSSESCRIYKNFDKRDFPQDLSSTSSQSSSPLTIMRQTPKFYDTESQIDHDEM